MTSALWRNRAALASGGVLAVATLTISTLAWFYEGVATADLELDDGGVWVTKADDLLVGHLNYPSRLLDGAVRTRAGSFDVLQDADRVLVLDESAGALTPVDPARIELTGDTALPASAQVALGGGTVGVLGDGMLYAVPFGALGGAVFDEGDALADVGAKGAVAVSRSGETVFAASAEHATLMSVDVATGAMVETPLRGLADDAELSVAAVGEQPVAFDRANAVAYLPNGTGIGIPGGEGGALQQSGDATDAAYIATRNALFALPLSGGDPAEVAGVDTGDPAAPVWLNGCAYAVWSGSGAYARDCGGDADDVATAIDLTAQATLTLRTNRRVVVVNDTTGGSVWIVDEQVQKVDNWEDIIPPADDDAEDDESEQEQQQFQLPERSAENHPPTAVDDQYGVRIGRSTIVRVTENDTDPDGDLLAAALVGEEPSGYRISPVLGGAALQVAVPANASGTVSFTYRVDDGRGGTDEASVTLAVRASGQNEPPQRKLTAEPLRVEAGASVTYDVLQGWEDPDGDDLYLVRASAPGGDTIAYRSNGVIEYHAASGETGLKEVALVVSDGIDQAEGVLQVDVRPAASLDPVANADRVTATAGTPLTVYPVANDLSPTGARPLLTKVEPAAGASVTPDYAGGSFTFQADQAGAYYVQYMITVGARSAVGIVRIDVVAASDDAIAPVAVRDLALLPTGRDVLVDVLANDADPAGGILVVQSAKAPANAAVSVEVLQHSVLRITDTSGLSSPITVSYTVSNGAQSAVGEVLVLPVPLPEKLRPPVAVPDTAVVRAGDVLTIHVLANDYHPDNDRIVLERELIDVSGIDEDAVFVDGDTIRMRAPDEPGTVQATYSIVDSQRQKVGALVTVQVLPPDEGTNSAPRPTPVVARVVAGNTVRVAIPLDGIDPDGDSVELTGVGSVPAKGRVSVGDTWLTYEAYPEATGRDAFTYTVRDRLGALAQSTVTVGVATPGFENQAPYAVKDAVTVKPGRKVAVAVTVNDSDPDGDEIAIDPNGLEANGIDAEVEGGRIVVTAPAEPGENTLTYTISDAYGATARGVLLVTVDDQAPLAPPVARDDRVPARAVGSKTAVDVAVLDNDEDPDGTTDALEVSTTDASAVVRAGGMLRIALADDPQIVRYRLTDVDGQTAQAFVFVPGLATLAPVVSSDEPIVVTSGEKVSILLAEHVAVRPGRSPRVATADSVKTGHSSGEPLIADERTLSYTSAADYYGPDVIGLLVTDGEGPDDPEGLTAYVTIPITVLPAENQPPRLRNASIVVAPGEEAVALNLAKLAHDPDEKDRDRLEFAIEGAVPDGYEASVSGSVLTVSAGPDVRANSTASLTVRVTDGITAPTTGTVSILAVTSQRPFPVANDDVVAEANQGETYRVDALANDFNPFPDTALSIVDARVDAAGTGTATVDGDRVAITPDAGFVGTMSVTYRIADATKSADRQVEGRIRLTVQGKPDAPGVPTVVSIQDRTVVLSWVPPSNNGAPILDYEVTSQNGYSTTCTSTTCTLGGLTNDVEYTFQVTARNEVGRSDLSPVSAVARPDARPDTPAPPTLAFGDQSLSVSWTTPRSAGSPVLSYNVEISPAPAFGAIQKTGVTGTSLTWDGLENGVAYQVRVQAVNRAPEPSQWSPYSALAVPAGVPDAPGTPTTTPATPVGAQAQITVGWTAPANANGDPVADYTLTVSRGGAVVNTMVVAGTSQNVVVEASETDYTFSVTARNKAGSSAPSAPSAPRRGAVAPGAPENVVATPADRAVDVSFTPGALNGNRAGEITYWYRVDQTGAQGTLPAGGGAVGGLTNGTSYTVSVWATSSVQGVQPGAEATSTAAVPFGKPIITFVRSERQNNAVQFWWTVDANGSPLTSQSHGVDGSGNATAQIGGLGAGATGSITVTYGNAAGSVSATWSERANDPVRTVTLERGSQYGGSECGTTCYFLRIAATGFAPNTTFTAACYADGESESFYTQNVTTNASGSLNIQLNCWSAYRNTRASVDGVFSDFVHFR
ncbi:Ig-like domain-containing protein [Microbacterium sp. BWT-B31]|uniref:Ig-like domain-containing protein n=1 Tax=Microbacterium sp. BWT-B31 TaxID=3232072 RepID=UPI003527BB23